MAFSEEVKRRELDVEDLVERLETKLTDVGSREIAVREGEIRLQLGIDGLQMQRVDTTEGLRKLTTQMANFKESRDQAEKDISERKAALFLWDRDLVARVERLNGIEKRLKEFEIRLKDERGVLDRIWKEIERKRIST
jgi:chromosome segregation ATPase